MGAFGGFDVEVEVRRGRGGGWPDGGVAGICEGTGLPVAESGEGVRGAAEGLGFCSSVEEEGRKGLAVDFSWGCWE